VTENDLTQLSRNLWRNKTPHMSFSLIKGN
jgi:hypothetical protein